MNECSTDILMGAAVGIKASGKNFNTYITVGWPLKTPERIQASSQSINYKLEARF